MDDMPWCEVEWNGMKWCMDSCMYSRAILTGGESDDVECTSSEKCHLLWKCKCICMEVSIPEETDGVWSKGFMTAGHVNHQITKLEGVIVINFINHKRTK